MEIEAVFLSKAKILSAASVLSYNSQIIIRIFISNFYTDYLNLRMVMITFGYKLLPFTGGRFIIVIIATVIYYHYSGYDHHSYFLGGILFRIYHY